jgi:hypothetical protein
LAWFDVAGALRFPSVLLQPLGHLSALESTICEQRETVYRKTLPQFVVFRDVICTQWFADTPKPSNAEIV